MTLHFQKIDALALSDHYYLDDEDSCFFLGEYTAGAGYAHSDTNDLISNLKKSPEKRGLSEWRYKGKAIGRCARLLGRALGASKWLKQATLVPIPPSCAKDDPLYDDRMVKVLRHMQDTVGKPLDIRELICQASGRPPAHTGTRLTPTQHAANWHVDVALTTPAPFHIGVFDDVLVTGSQYKAAQSLLNQQFPGVPVVGIFIARRVPVDDEEEDWGAW